MLSPGFSSHSSNHPRRLSFFSRFANFRTTGLSFALWLRKTSYLKSLGMGCSISQNDFPKRQNDYWQNYLRLFFEKNSFAGNRFAFREGLKVLIQKNECGFGGGYLWKFLSEVKREILCVIE